ncbi:hypothetical protein HUN08_08250 [Gordonia sp. X0973]|uniref:putative nucleotidyltransferase substrate binding domain-containing protein n=1 Tax=Gordonia sp. X0973 TaxID=2742602 RepID=UPI000F533A22|nr:putative nucleotidyltransferase substrate binding domain-containing protein [Gordonia sp. X0973]QKT07188.1 hypothetical protein HUN08_08250 [Gordonia sp. X0973]
MSNTEPDDGLAVVATAADRAVLGEAIAAARDAIAARAHRLSADEAAARWSALVVEAVGSAARVVGAPTGMRWQWFVTGSCGRGEGLPGADVETLVGFEPSSGDTADVLERAAQVHELIERVGLAPDRNGAIGSRSRCCRTVSGWATAIDGWAADPAADRGVVMSGLALDSRPAGAGGGASVDLDLCGAVLRAGKQHPGLGRAMAQDSAVVREAVPARLAVLAGRRETVDLKRAVLDPITRLGRLKAVLGGTGARSTRDRLGADNGILDEIDWPALERAWTSVTAIRWALRSGDWQRSGAAADVVGLRDLAPHDRAIVRSAGREVLGAQRVLRYLTSVQTS